MAMRFVIALLVISSAAAAQQASEVERVHVVERRPFSESNRFELSVFGLGQLNPRFTVHAGVGAELAYHLRENLAAQIGFSYNAISHQSAVSEELAAKVDQQPVAATALLLQADALAGIEFMPIYGKISIFDGNVLRLGLYVNAGLGVAKTQLQLRPADSNGGRSFGDTGFRPEGALGIGTRIFAGDRLTFRIEVRDRLYSAYVSKVNGCTGQDAQTIRANGAAATGLSPGCSPGSFGSTDEQIKSGAGSAAVQLGQPSSNVINNIALQGGVSWLF